MSEGEMLSAGRTSRNLSRDLDEALRHAEVFFEPQLVKMGLGEAQIRELDSVGLQRALQTVNDALSRAESFGGVQLELSATASVLITQARSDAHYTLTITSILLQRKSLILERINAATPPEHIEHIKEQVAEQVSNEQARDRLFEALDETEREKTLLKEQLETERMRAEQEFEMQARIARLRVELSERRSQMWRGFLERESVATIIGAFLLVVLTFALLVAMFTKHAQLEVLANSYLLILGYFFGQSANRSRRE
jgi:hypothetical protein